MLTLLGLDIAIWGFGPRKAAAVAMFCSLCSMVFLSTGYVQVRLLLGDPPGASAQDIVSAVWMGSLLLAFSSSGALLGNERLVGLSLAALWTTFLIAGFGLACLVIGAAAGLDTLLTAAAWCLAPVTVSAVTFLVTSQYLPQGLLHSLDHLANVRPFSWITNWPSDE